MVKTVPAINIGQKDNAVAVATMLTSAARQQVIQLQQKLARIFPSAFWFMPASALHITLCEILQAKPYTQNKDTIFERDKEKYQLAIESALANIGTITVHFTKIEASPEAIIVEGYDKGQFAAIRNKLLKTLPFPPTTTRPPRIIHSTIARYTRTMDLSPVQQAVERCSVDFTMNIAQFQLMNQIWPHLLRYQLVQRYLVT